MLQAPCFPVPLCCPARSTPSSSSHFSTEAWLGLPGAGSVSLLQPREHLLSHSYSCIASPDVAWLRLWQGWGTQAVPRFQTLWLVAGVPLAGLLHAPWTGTWGTPLIWSHCVCTRAAHLAALVSI